MTYAIIGRYEGQKFSRDPEKVDTAESREDAETLLGEYRMAFGPEWTLWVEEGSDQ